MRPFIPPRLSPLAYGVIQAAITSAVATTIATIDAAPAGLGAVWYWLACWSCSWLAMLPIIILLSPFIQQTVQALTKPLG